jgi:hypothetical protein
VVPVLRVVLYFYEKAPIPVLKNEFANVFGFKV